MTKPVSIKLPVSEEQIRELKCGDFVLLSGIIFTARDAAHKRLVKGETPESCDLNAQIIYHCGPVTVMNESGWTVTAAGPTTSGREEPYMDKIIKDFKLRAVIGKGGMGKNTLAACEKHGCVYLHAVGGTAQVLADTIERVEDVYWLDQLGPPEAIWKLQVKDFPAVVTMDSHGKSLHDNVEIKSKNKLKKLLQTK